MRKRRNLDSKGRKPTDLQEQTRITTSYIELARDRPHSRSHRAVQPSLLSIPGPTESAAERERKESQGCNRYAGVSTKRHPRVGSTFARLTRYKRARMLGIRAIHRHSRERIVIFRVAAKGEKLAPAQRNKRS